MLNIIKFGIKWTHLAEDSGVSMKVIWSAVRVASLSVEVQSYYTAENTWTQHLDKKQNEKPTEGQYISIMCNIVMMMMLFFLKAIA